MEQSDSGGLFNQLNNAKHGPYDKLSLSKLKEVLNDLYAEPNEEPKRKIIFYTGYEGMYIFHFGMQMLGYPSISYSFQHFAKYKDFYINLYKKHGVYKVKVKRDDDKRLELYYGTQLVLKAEHFDQINNYLQTTAKYKVSENLAITNLICTK